MRDLGGFEWDVFLGYASDDRPRAEALYRALMGAGLKVFFDRVVLQPGDNWMASLPAHLRSSDVAVFLVSERTPEAHYQQSEMVTAIAAARDDPRRRVVPVRLSQEATLPYGTEQLQALDMVTDQDIAAVARRIAEVVPRGRDRTVGTVAGRPDPPSGQGATILHLSDLGFGPAHPFSSAGPDSLAARLLQGLYTMQGLVPAVDLVVISGDVTERGLRSEFAVAHQFVDDLLAGLGLRSDRLVVVPGERDVNQALCAAYFGEQAGNEVEPEPPFGRKWEPYADFVRELFGPTVFTPDRPYDLHRFDDLGLVVAAMNSTMAESHLDHFGWCGETQLRWFAEQLESHADHLHLGLIHHDPGRRAGGDEECLRDADQFLRLLGPVLDVVVHGHARGEPPEVVGTSDGGLSLLAAGAAAAPSDAAGNDRTHRCGVVRLEPASLTRWALRYEPASQRWVGDTSATRSGGNWREVVKPPSRPHWPHGDISRPTSAGFPDEVAAVTRLREGVADVEVRRLASVDYLAVVTTLGEMYAVGLVDGPLDEEVFTTFCSTVHQPTRSRDSAARSFLVHTGPVDEDWRRKGSRQGITVNTWAEYQNLLDLSAYRRDLVLRMTEDEQYPQDLYLDQRYRMVRPDGRAYDTVLDELAEVVIDDVVTEGPRFVLVLGDPGFGKSFLVRRVSHLLLSGESGITPVMILLREAEKRHGLEEMVAPALAASASTFQGDRFRRMFRNGRIVLLVDGYDEFAVRVGYDRAAQQLRTFLGAIEGQAKILLTTRPNHFRSREDVTSQVFEDVLGLDANQRRVYELEPFDQDQQRLFLRKWFTLISAPADSLAPDSQADQWMAALGAVDNLPELARTPRMLSFMAQRLDLDQIRAAGRAEGPVTAAGLYEMLVDTWLATESAKFGEDRVGAGDDYQLDREQRFHVAEELAYRLWATAEPHISEGLLEEVAREVLDLPALGITVAQAAHEIGSRTLIVGDGDQRHFAHQSIGEFLLARRLASVLQRSERPPQLRQAELSELTARFLCDLAPEEGVRWLRSLADDDQPDGPSADA